MKTLIFLPATEPDDTTYGTVPESIDGFGDLEMHTIQYPRLVWYSKPIQDEAIAQIRALDISSAVLVGFSKSGLGAWNVARAIPELISATIIFDSPVARQELPKWGTAPFYADNATWQEDLPINTVEAFTEAMPPSHRLVLISGPGFREEMLMLSETLSKVGHKHAFLDRPELAHHWNSGWIEDGLNEALNGK